jgi:hypothetical protein
MKSDNVISKQEFEELSPYLRGYTVYMAGTNAAQPHVPDERNPYADKDAYKAAEWERGSQEAQKTGRR